MGILWDLFSDPDTERAFYGKGNVSIDRDQLRNLRSVLATERALREKRERQIEKLERLCSKGSNYLIFGPSGVGCWEIDDEDGDSWVESDTFTGLLAAIDEATGEK